MWKLISTVLAISLILMSVYCVYIMDRNLKLTGIIKGTILSGENIKTLNSKVISDLIKQQEDTNKDPRSTEDLNKMLENQIIDDALVGGPKRRVGYDEIHLFANNLYISIPNLLLGKIADTGSMLPVLTTSASTLELEVDNPSELQVGDIVSYYDADDVIVHRIIEIGEDDIGWYAILKGDSLDSADPDKVRFQQIKSVVVGIIY